MAYNDSPDRRPLLYGFAALLILVAAGFLFWPRGDRTDEPGLVFTPTTEESQLASQMETPTEDASGAESSTAADLGSDTPPERIESQPITETEYAVETDRASQGSSGGSTPSSSSSTSSRSSDSRAGSSTSTSPSSTTPTRSTQSSPQAIGSDRPGPNGAYLLYIGSFSTRENAQRRVTELQGKGIPAEISQGSKPDGSAIYRVRVGYFEGHSRAKAYGEELKSRHKIDYWIAER